MRGVAYYNENDPSAAAWLRNLIDAGLIAPGDVDERSICDVSAADLDGYTQHHLFAGIGGWSYALRLAGWPDDRPVATGSCPCQPFSSAGKREGVDDERHLWPAFRWLIAQRRFPVVFGEQVASGDGRRWLDGVRIDLEAMGYAVGAADLCAAGLGAPHIRQRLWWVAYAENIGNCRTAGRTRGEARKTPEDGRCRSGRAMSCGSSADGGVGDSDEQGPQGHGGPGRLDVQAGRKGEGRHAAATGDTGEGMGEAQQQRSQGRNQRQDQSAGRAQPADFWSAFDTVHCDERRFGRGIIQRRIEPGTFPLAHGIPARVGRLRGYGNAIVPQVAAQFIRAAEGDRVA